jgi:hypothetical protein
MTQTIVADLIRTDRTSVGLTIELEADGQPRGTIDHDGVHYSLAKYHADKGIASYVERK